MKPILTRRSFLASSAMLMAGATWHKGATSSSLQSISLSTSRPLGKTGITCSLVGMGTGVRSWNGESELTRKGRPAFMEVLEYACDQGITFFDLADMYGSHDYVKEALSTFMDRDKVMLSTKTVSREPEAIRADLERFRKELDTDVLDVVLMHCLTQRDGPDWRETLAPAMEVMAEAKAKGIIRAHGVSCHDFQAMEYAAASDWVDVILARINPAGVHMDGPVEDVVAILEACHDSGKGVLGMKIIGEGGLHDRVRESLEFAMGLGCIDAMTIGFLDTAEIDDIAAKLEQITL